MPTTLLVPASRLGVRMHLVLIRGCRNEMERKCAISAWLGAGQGTDSALGMCHA